MKLKKISALLLALVMVLGTMSIAVFAEDTATALADFTYTQDDTALTVTLTKYTGSDTAVVVPGTYDIEVTDGEGTTTTKTYAVIIDSTTTFVSNTSITSVTLKEGVTFANDSMNSLFYGCTALTSVDLSATDTTGVTDMSRMFYGCKKLTAVDLSNFDTSAVTTFYAMFYSCSTLTSVDLSSFVTSAVTDMSYLFASCKALPSVDLTNFDTSLVTTFKQMFDYCYELAEIKGLEDFDTGNVESLYYTFYRMNYNNSDDEADITLDLSNWDLSKVTSTKGCFCNCYVDEILLPDSLPIISGFTFDHTYHLDCESFTIPAGVEKIGYAHVFYNMGNNSFVEFKVAEGNENYVAIDGILYSADGTEMLGVPRGKTFENNTYTVPDGVTFLPELCISRNMNIHKLVLPDSYQFRQCIYQKDPQYTLGDDGGNASGTANSLTLATYKYSGVNEYEVYDSNSNYATKEGILYNKDMTSLLAIPVRYAQHINIPEGVERWELSAMWTWTPGTGIWATDTELDKLMVGSSGVDIPASLTYIEPEQVNMLNRIEEYNGTDIKIISGFDDETAANLYSTYPMNFTISVADDNPVYQVNADGKLEQYAITENDITLSEDFYAYDGNAKTPDVTVTLNGATLEEGTDYDVTYSNNTDAGIATVTVTGLNGYSTYNATKTFVIGQAKIGDTGYATLAEAVTAANAMGGDVTIELLQDTTFSEMMTIAAGTNITIEGGGYTLTRFDDETDDANDYTGGLFTVSAGASLILNDLTIDGNNNWTLDKDAVLAAGKITVKTHYAAETGAPVATKGMFDVNGSVTVNNTTIQNNAGAGVFILESGSSVTLNDGTTVTHCANSSGGGTVFAATGGEIVINEGVLISDNYGQNNGAVASINGDYGPTLTMNGGEIIDNYCGKYGIFFVIGTDEAPATVIMNDGVIKNNFSLITAVYIQNDGEMYMYDGEISNNVFQYDSFGVIHSANNDCYLTIYDGTIIDNYNYKNSPAPSVTANYKADSRYGHAELYGGEYSLYECGTYGVTLDTLCATGYTAYLCDDGLYRVIKVMTVEFEEVVDGGTESEKLYNINLLATEDDEINRLNSVDLTFAFEKEGDIAYEIIASNPEIEINPVENSDTRYEFHYKDKEDDVTSDTGAKITIGQVKFTGFGTFSFSVDENATTNAAHATELEDNIVDKFIASGEVGEDAIAGESYLDISNIIEDEIELPLRNLKINITFPNTVEYNAAAYQDMKVTITGGTVDKEILLGKESFTETTDETTGEAIANLATVTVLEGDCGYAISLDLPYNTTYTVAVEGAGYRTARYSVILSENKILNFWNNVKDNAEAVEEGAESSAVTHNFVAGEVVDDNNINIYDLSAVLSYFAAVVEDKTVTSEYSKYDLNRDGVIDSKDVAYVLVSWGN